MAKPSAPPIKPCAYNCKERMRVKIWLNMPFSESLRGFEVATHSRADPIGALPRVPQTCPNVPISAALPMRWRSRI